MSGGFYLENIASKLVADSIGLQEVDRIEMVERKFVEPQLRRGIEEDIPPSDYSVITDWLAGSSPGILVLVGQGGIGKTWVMMNLRSRVTLRTLEFSNRSPKGSYSSRRPMSHEALLRFRSQTNT